MPSTSVKSRLRLPALPVRRSVLASLFFASAIILWVISGLIGGGSDAVEAARPISQNPAAAEKFKVIVRDISSQPYQAKITLQARTEADQIVTIAAETTGIITAQDIAKGSFVKQGQVVCQIDVGARQAQLDEARALLRSRQIELGASQKLQTRGYNSPSQVAKAQAAYDAAAAAVKAREVELRRTKIVAPFDGILDSTPVERGDFITIGMPCATIIDKDPLLVVAFVAENQISSLRVGAQGVAQLATGEEVQGKLTYIAESPDPNTRTFKIEMETDNKNLRLRDGITARLQIETEQVQASFIPQGVLTLNNDGIIGVRVLVGDIVAFRPVEILSDDMGGAYVRGLNPQETLITVGAEFTRDGQAVVFEYEQNAQQNSQTESRF